MKFVEPKVERVITEQDNRQQMMDVIESAFRICYQSEHKKTDDQHELVERLLHPACGDYMSEHTSPLEHRRIVLSITDNVYNQICDYPAFEYIKTTYLPRAGISSVLIEGNIRAFYNLMKDALICGVPNRAITLLSVILRDAFPKIFHIITFDGQYPVDLHQFEQNKYLGESQEYATFRIVTSRDILLEIERHRTLSLNAESTRYCNYAKDDISFTVPRGYAGCDDVDWSSIDHNDIITRTWPCRVLWSNTSEEISVDQNNEPVTKVCEKVWVEPQPITIEQQIEKCQDLNTLHMLLADASAMAYKKAISLGYKPQEARMLLLGSTKTEILLTGTTHAWKMFIKLRSSEHADPRIKFLSDRICEQLKRDSLI